MFAAVYWKSCKPFAAWVAMVGGSLLRLILEFSLPKVGVAPAPAPTPTHPHPHQGLPPPPPLTLTQTLTRTKDYLLLLL